MLHSSYALACLWGGQGLGHGEVRHLGANTLILVDPDMPAMPVLQLEVSEHSTMAGGPR